MTEERRRAIWAIYGICLNNNNHHVSLLFHCLYLVVCTYQSVNFRMAITGTGCTVLASMFPLIYILDMQALVTCAAVVKKGL